MVFTNNSFLVGDIESKQLQKLIRKYIDGRLECVFVIILVRIEEVGIPLHVSFHGDV